MKQNQKPLRALLLLIPIILGTIGLFALEKEPFTDAVFHCVQMYVLNYSDTPPNLFVEAARWIAPLASAYSVLLIASALRTRLQNLLRSRHFGAVAVYGPEEECAPLLAALDRKGVSGGSAPAGTDRHILLWNEEENFRFYARYRDVLAGKVVYLKCGSLPAQAASGADLHIFCPEETAARLYWKDHCLYETSCACSHKMQIVLIGFGKLGSELLTSALQSNIFSPDQRIEYHVFGGDPAYLKIHHELGNLQDLVLFHEEPWQDNLALLESAERILIVQQEGQTEVLTQLLLAVNSPRIDLFDANAAASGLLDGKDRIVRFPWKEIAYRPENILSEDLYRRAKALNLRYAHLYAGAAETVENREAEWRKLDTFTRYSNISSADYHEIRLKMLQGMGEPSDPDRISPSCMELLAELEHMRWCRYHWLNNWTYGVPERGGNKDSARKIHADLRPYDQLSEQEKQKDRDAVCLLLELDKSGGSAV